jgi:hypothetical protein
MSELQKIADSDRAVTIKGAWYGPSLAELLAEISPQLATMQPTLDGHSISALLQHLLLWNERVRNTSESNPMPRWQAAGVGRAGDSLERPGDPLERKP